jgi:phosphoribosyl-ATP pyrophosphohydrolase/phosphoribosyl-AMP cyclohydrolase
MVSMMRIQDLAWQKDGLIPAVVQDAATGEVLTLAYVSPDSLAKTAELGETVFFSRSRKEIWHKGETSGNTQSVATIMADCDADALVIRVHPRGPACHTGSTSCFYREIEDFDPDRREGMGLLLGELEQLIADRKSSRPEGSYTSKLFDRGRSRILQKVGEEAVETILAATGGDREEVSKEAADLLFHLLVALSELDISLEDVARELRSRRK